PARRFRRGVIINAPLELARDARQMAMHCRARRLGIFRRDRGRDRRVIADRAYRKVVGMEMPLQPSPKLCALVPEALDDELERAVSGCLREQQVKVAILRLTGGEVVEMVLEPRHAFLQRLDVLRARVLRRERRNLALEELAGREEFERPWTRIAARPARRIGLRDEDAGADAHFDEAAHLERDDRLA